VFIGPQLRLPGGDSGAVEFEQTGLPFVYQLCGLTRAALGTGKHPLHMDALLGRFVGLAGGMIGHMILTHKERRTTGFYTSWIECRERVPALADRLSIDPGLGCLFQNDHCLCSPHTAALRGWRFGRLWLRFVGAFCGAGFECGEDDGGGLLNDFETLGE
jgi:hypothetical protein